MWISNGFLQGLWSNSPRWCDFEPLFRTSEHKWEWNLYWNGISHVGRGWGDQCTHSLALRFAAWGIVALIVTPPHPVAEGESACRSSLLSVLHDVNRTSDDDYQGRDLCDPFCIFAGWEVGAWPGLLVWSSSGWTRLITGQCHFWTLSKGLGWGSDCKIRPLLLRREPADKSEACAEVVSVSTWTDWLMITCRQDPTAVYSVYLLQQQGMVRICSHTDDLNKKKKSYSFEDAWYSQTNRCGFFYPVLWYI